MSGLCRYLGEFLDAGVAGGQQRGDNAPATVGQNPAVRAGEFFEQARLTRRREVRDDLDGGSWPHPVNPEA